MMGSTPLCIKNDRLRVPHSLTHDRGVGGHRMSSLNAIEVATPGAGGWMRCATTELLVVLAYRTDWKRTKPMV